MHVGSLVAKLVWKARWLDEHLASHLFPPEGHLNGTLDLRVFASSSGICTLSNAHPN